MFLLCRKETKGLSAKMENVPGSLKIRPNDTSNLEIVIMIS
jgi:hypothetical protein